MLADTIKEIRKKNYLNQAAFAKMIGVTQSAVSQWENDLTRPNSYQLEAIAKAFNISVDQLLKTENDIYIRIKKASVPILGSIHGGKQVMPDTEPDGYADLPDGANADFALRCVGDSMSPLILDGDLVLIRQQPDVEEGQIAAVNIDGETTLKHVYHQKDGLLLISENSKYKPIYAPFSPDKEILIHGLAVGYTRFFE